MISLRLLRRIKTASGPSVFGQITKSPHQKIESLERWSGWATLLILAGIIADIVVLLWFPHSNMERVAGTVANIFIALGLIVEYVCIMGVIVATREANRESDEKVAAANTRAEEAKARAAEADRARAELEVKLQPRMLNQEQYDIIEGLRGKFDQINVAFETDAETRWFANQLIMALMAVGIRVGMYARAADKHSTGSMIYEPSGLDGAHPRTVWPLIEIFQHSAPIRIPHLVIGTIPDDIPAAPNIPMIIAAGRFELPPAHMTFPRSAAKADPANKT